MANCVEPDWLIILTMGPLSVAFTVLALSMAWDIIRGWRR